MVAVVLRRYKDWDLGVCLQYECRRKQLRKPDILNGWIDLRATYKLFYRRRPKGLNGALQDLGIEFSGREHSGLDDARNTAHLAWRMICDGCVMKITKSLNRQVPVKRISVVIREEGNTSECKDKAEITSKGSTGIIDQNLEEKTKEDIFANSKNKSILKEVQTKSPAVRGSGNQTHKSEEPAFGAAAKSTELYIQSLVAPKTILNGLSMPTGFGKVHKPSYCVSKNLKNGFPTGKLTSTPNDGHSFTNTNPVLIPTVITSVNNISDTELSSVSETESILPDWEEAAILTESDEEIHDSTAFRKCLTPHFNDASLLPEEHLLNCAIFKDPVPEATKPSAIVYKSPNTTIYDVGGITKSSSGSSTFKMPISKPDISEPSNASQADATLQPRDNKGVKVQGKAVSSGKLVSCQNVQKRKSSTTSLILPPVKQSFTVYQDKESLVNKSSTSTSSSFSCVLPTALRSFNLNQSSLLVTKTKKITPPLCNCGRRTKKLTVSNAGPNHGKTFYCCPVGNRHGENKKGCHYFKWEHTLFKEKSLTSSLLLSTSRASSTSAEISLVSTTALDSPETRSLGLRPSMRT